MNGPELTDSILYQLQILRTRHMMIIPHRELTYTLVYTYLEGYLSGIGLAIGRKLPRNIDAWHSERLQKAFAMGYMQYIPYLHKEASQSELIKLLLDGIETYFKQNPDWQEADIPRRIWFDEDE